MGRNMLVGLSLASRRKIIEDRTFRERRAFDLRCGNGSISNLLSQLGFEVIGVDPGQAAVHRLARHTFARSLAVEGEIPGTPMLVSAE